ncbi:MAG TPA: hypothetical protein VGB61_09435 [Pyrinomonadaceae bacterium]
MSASGRLNREPGEFAYTVPVRRTRWVSFWVGLAAVFIAALAAAMSVAAFGGLLTLLKVEVDGFWIIFLFGLFCFGLFFLSYPLQRRYARSRDLRWPGISLNGGVLSVPLEKKSTLHFNLGEPHELAFGWCEHVMTSVSYQGTHTRGVWTHAMLTQNGQGLYLIAEDSIREAQSAGWPKRTIPATPTMPRVSMWASDLVALLEAIRTRSARRGG